MDLSWQSKRTQIDGEIYHVHGLEKSIYSENQHSENEYSEINIVKNKMLHFKVIFTVANMILKRIGLNNS